MATITVRNLDEAVQRAIRARAAENGRSMEAEARAILTESTRSSGFLTAWLSAATTAGPELDLPARTPPREIDLS
jgi:plasmid stability protein